MFVWDGGVQEIVCMHKQWTETRCVRTHIHAQAPVYQDPSSTNDVAWDLSQSEAGFGHHAERAETLVWMVAARAARAHVREACARSFRVPRVSVDRHTWRLLDPWYLAAHLYIQAALLGGNTMRAAATILISLFSFILVNTRYMTPHCYPRDYPLTNFTSLSVPRSNARWGGSHEVKVHRCLR